jgi:hypothetical protein
MKASDHQVDGDHYRTEEGGVGHWDYCVAVDAPYLEGGATKYIARWRDKNGLVDLDKGLHYMQRKQQAYEEGQGNLMGCTRNDELFKQFIRDNKISPPEAYAIDLCLHWEGQWDLVAAIESIETLIRVENGEPTSAYVDQD